ncbi:MULTISPECIES: cell division ATP-binding protein FtsE [Arcobacteraceae]|jgi:cell division transport system ATP-binding protein|uniref:ABC transporter ATP-binding protein n=5 Tax=Arcobacteraceae TaxID=2808963 RepID=A0AAP4UXZ0_9BACT|nr:MULTISPECIES: ABC transporter ATP-binding protein [Arcobacteraceae]AGR77309.1 cell division ATP-binding protein FtsE [Aliarcobacter butzleri 7h1h]KLE01277.1 ABC transporter ATP-binding protein [Aliarcobacter butzleri L348]KLE03029.1 ABC transporter ATP-binding protein [Aliarcobacter butzleri L352]KLE09218.1 ABC transporter ATP-binding protein [Aliarcobacter butzleri L355]KLE10001.1 ABC transporter ATP-binding protein [Aliarcobacter butzleri L354]
MIEARNIYLTYDDNRYIIKKGNFTIKPKEFIFIGGNSGSGKSTLLKSFYGDIPLKHGSLKIENQEVFGIKGKKLRLLRKDIGIIFQDYKLINEYTIEENIMIPLKINGYSHEVSQVQADNLLKHVRLSHRKGFYPNQLSGGEQQRVAVARALAHNPKIIIADEPTGNLDDFSAEVVWNLLKGANEQLGITVVVVTHRVPKNLGIKFRQLSIEDGIIYEVS